MDIRVGAVTLDCAETVPLARFWAELLGGEIAFESEGFAAVKLENLWITAQQIDDFQEATWPTGDVAKQIHLDLAVEDLATTSARALELGARLADVQPGPDRYLVLIDPAGHPFCLTTQIPE